MKALGGHQLKPIETYRHKSMP